MPTKQKSRGAKKGAKTQTKVVVKTGVKTSTLVALAWAVAFASMGMAASAVTPTPAKHLIGSFTETVHVLAPFLAPLLFCFVGIVIEIVCISIPRSCCDCNHIRFFYQSKLAPLL